MILIQILCYVAILIFFVASISKIIKVANMPVHLRWELYPVPHEKGRASYGGSKLEENEWWKKEHKKDHFNEWKEMGTEIVFLKAVWEFNRSLWIGTFPFHFGLYMMITNMVLLFIGGIFQLTGNPVTPDSSGIALILYYLILAIAWTASIMGVFGAIRLMFSRIVDNGLRKHSSLSHYFNIIFIGAIYLTVLLWLMSGNEFVNTMTGFYASMISFSALVDFTAIAVWHLIIAALFIMYLPFTHMSHMYMKYFLYHSVRWEDGENTPGSILAEKLGRQLAYPVSWSAVHVDSDGTKTWGEVVSNIPEKM
ncbi:MAG: respiratory nitrate reductase subunit gamma [bacterium]